MTNNSTNTYIVPTTANEVTQPSQPAFLARNDAAQANVTGDGTDYTVITATEIFDQNADFDGTSTFTAPVTGKYHFSTSVPTTGFDGTQTNISIRFVTSNRQYYYSIYKPENAVSPVDNGNVLADMDAADTCIILLSSGGGNKSVDINDFSVTYSFFAGTLIC